MKILLIFVLLAEAYLCLRILRARYVNIILALSLVVATLLRYFLPGALALVKDYGKIANPVYDISETQFISAYLLEAVAVCFIMYIFMIAAKQRFSLGERQKIQVKLSRRRAYLLILSYSAIIVYRISTNGFDYLANNSASLYDLHRQEAILFIIGQLIFSAIVLVAIGLPRGDPLAYLLIGIIVIESSLFVIAGSRIWLIAPLLIVGYRYFRRPLLNKQAFWYGLAGVVILVYLILPLSYIIQETRQKGAIDLAFRISEYERQERDKSYLKMLFTKFDSFSPGYSLIRDGGGMGCAGFVPYYGSALIFIPRAIWPSRPVAGSADGTIYGHPSRLTRNSLLAFSDYANIGVSPLHVSLWQLGIPGGGIFIIAAIGFLTFINHLLLGRFFFHRVVGIYMLTIPTFHEMLPSPDVILKKVVIAIPLLAVSFSLRILARIYNRKKYKIILNQHVRP